MSTKKPIADVLRERLTDVAERGRVLGQALKVRADMAATRRRLRLTFAELGEEAYAQIADGRLPESPAFVALRQRIDGLKAEVRQREDELRQVMHGGLRPAAEIEAAAADDAGPEGSPTLAGS